MVQIGGRRQRGRSNNRGKHRQERRFDNGSKDYRQECKRLVAQLRRKQLSLLKKRVGRERKKCKEVSRRLRKIPQSQKTTLKARRHRKRNKRGGSKRCEQMFKRKGRYGSSGLGFLGFSGLGGMFGLPNWMFVSRGDRFSFNPK